MGLPGFLQCTCVPSQLHGVAGGVEGPLDPGSSRALDDNRAVTSARFPISRSHEAVTGVGERELDSEEACSQQR